MTDTVVAEGQVKFRDGKKWKSRWVVLRKPSPVADCLSLLVYKEKKGKEKGRKERLNVTLEGICGVEPASGYDGVSYTLTILCSAHTLVLGFSSHEALLAWDARVRYSLGEVHRFSVNVEPGTKVESGPASLHLCNNVLILTRGLPPVVVGHWKLSALRRYGAVPNGFVFEGGTRCGYWAGVFMLSCSEGEHISFLFDCIVRGVAPSRTPHGVQPSLPDLSADPASAEERLNQEASALEKRLSMLSQCSLASSTGSTYSCTTSAAGDDRSSISSSSSSQSDTSYGKRLPFWAEPLARLHLSSETVSSSSTLKALNTSDDRLYGAMMAGGGTRPSSAQLQSRGLHDSGRQSSLDSGIGIATGSQSSYSGSCSSCTGSLDAASQGGGEEFDSATTCPPAPRPTSPPSSPLPPPASPFQSTLTPEPSYANPCTSSRCNGSRSSSRASVRHSEDYQIPNLLRARYDTPRSLLQTLSLRENSAQGATPEPRKDSRSCGDGGGGQGLSSSSSSKAGLRAQPQAVSQQPQSRASERAPSVDSEGRSTPRSLSARGGLVCEEAQSNHDSDNYITPEQWRSVRNRCLTQVACSPSSGISQDPPLYVREEHDDSVEAGLKKSLSSLPPSGPPPPPITLTMYRPTPACGTFQFPPEAAPSGSLDAGLHSDSAINYVNIPIRTLLATTNRELLQEAHHAVTEQGSIRNGQHNFAAMETAQRVGAEQAHDREDRLSQLEDRQQGHQTKCSVQLDDTLTK
ncbi:Dok-7-like isoform X2 [Solea senegalensis]|uniref:Dok-7-like isoform X2 n=1 Tax=Solea senegalensis TaxID=28829 RepID=A0AAV6Q765_SOLSE|nr:protein Dok-7-like [Solea senegalensis]KAG7485897.1 Dok-7-like isoform X2 [Solea senegalensis]